MYYVLKLKNANTLNYVVDIINENNWPLKFAALGSNLDKAYFQNYGPFDPRVFELETGYTLNECSTLRTKEKDSAS